MTLDDLDPGAKGAIGFFVGRLRETFVVPMLATDSREAFISLWSVEGGAALRLMDGVFLCLYEAQRASHSEVITKRLAYSDRQVIQASAQTIEQHFDAALAGDLRLALTLVEEARAVLASLHPSLKLIKLFHQGLLVWALGNHLSIELAERFSSLVRDTELRSDLAADTVAFAEDGARMAGYFAAAAAGLRVMNDVSEHFQSTPFVMFMLRATLQIKRVFGEQTRFAASEFVYPEDPEEWELHLVIDSPAAPQEAGEALDRLCDEWWDSAAAELDVDIYPVLGVVHGG
ncbi:MAG TPA: hypothetical protein ENJ18_14140 [Nannocystis exedens]|nr:hypothetical protein [Nannocystis exedens]